MDPAQLIADWSDILNVLVLCLGQRSPSKLQLPKSLSSADCVRHVEARYHIPKEKFSSMLSLNVFHDVLDIVIDAKGWQLEEGIGGTLVK